MTPAEESNNVQLRLNKTTTSFTRDIPSTCARRSGLITELREQLTDEQTLPLPLSTKELEAWIAYVSSACASNGAASVDDVILLRALKAAEFLRDETTVSEVTDNLVAMFRKAMEGPVTEEMQARIHTVVNATPPDTLLSLLTTLNKPISSESKGVFARRPDVTSLLRVMPRSSHPAAVQTFCVSAPDQRACVLDLDLDDKSQLQTPRRAARYALVRPRAATAATLGIGDTPEAGPPGMPHACATPAMQLLAAAAPLAGGSADAACFSGGDSGTAAAPMQAGASFPASGPRAPAPSTALPQERIDQLCQDIPELRVQLRKDNAGSGTESSGGCRWQLPGGALTRMELHVRLGAGTPAGPPRWWDAIGEMRTLRALCLDIFEKESDRDLGAAALTAALRRLPALEDLELRYLRGPADRNDDPYSDGYNDYDDYDDYDTGAVDCDPAVSLQLLHGMVSLSQLSALTLHGCFDFPVAQACPATGPAALSAIDVIARMSQLSRLTSLAFDSTVGSGEWVVPFAAAVNKLPALQRLQACLCVKDTPQAVSAAEELQLALVAGPGSPALNNISFTVRPEYSFDRTNPDCQPQRLHERMRERSPARLARMTALDLTWGGIRADGTQGSALAAMLADMPALESLRIGSTALDDVGLQGVARALPVLTALTHLCITHDWASGPGVVAVLAALLEPGAAGPERLRHLDVSGNRVQPESIQAVADSLRQFRCLEHLDVSDMELEKEALQKAVAAAEALPELRRFEAHGNRVNSVRAMFSDAARVPEMTFDA